MKGEHINACAKMYIHVQKCTSFINKNFFPGHEKRISEILVVSSFPDVTYRLNMVFYSSLQNPFLE